MTKTLPRSLPEVLMAAPRDVAGTRRDGPRPPGDDRRGVEVPAQTRREGDLGPATGPGETRRDGGAAASGVPGFPALPPEVAGRYRPVQLLAHQGAEADVFLVADATEEPRVLKAYRRDIAPDPEVWAALPHARSRHLVAVAETGTTLDGRKFEVMEYLEHGDLRHVAGLGRPDPATVREIVSQLADGLAALHGVRIIHRDLKPENVLVRRTRPLELVLTDFGLARRLDQTSAFSSAARTLLYTAPETFAGHLSPARDWWSLGMIVRELVTGERPFAGWTEEVIVAHLMTRSIDLARVTDPRVALLCRGLLVRDPQDRWGATQVREWLDGGTPPVAEDRSAAPAAGRPLVFRGDHADPVALAAALEEHWADAARTFFARPGNERWRGLKEQLGQFDDTPYYRGEARQDLCDELDAGPWPPDVKLVRLLTLLAPERPPSYRGVTLRPEDLAGVAARAAGGDADSRRLVGELWDQQLLPVLGGRTGAARLTEIDGRWRTAHADYRRAADEVAERHPGLGPRLEEPDARMLGLTGSLLAATTGDGAAQRVDEAIGQLAGRLPRPVDWFDDLQAWRRPDPARSLAVLAVAPAATAQAEQTVREEQERREQALARQREWSETEADRLRGRDAAVGKALTGAAVLLAFWIVVAVVSGGGGAAIFGFVVLMIQTGVEIGLARGMGRDYYPEYSLLRGGGRLAGRVGGFFSAHRVLGVVAIIACIGVASALPWLIAVLVLLGHGGWAVKRWNDWQQTHAEQQRAVLGGGQP